MKLAWFIAFRYLFAKKSRQVINVISWISAAGIALGTMALVIVLSVYNGFDGLVMDMYQSFDADLVVKPTQGKTFTWNQVLEQCSRNPQVAACSPVLEETVFLRYRGQQAVGVVKGIDSTFLAVTPLKERVTSGDFEVLFGEVEEAVVGRGLAGTLGVNVHFVDPLWLFFPDKDAVFSPLNPMASLKNVKVYPAGIFAVEQNFDTKHLFVPLVTLRRLLDVQDGISYVEIRLKEGVSERPLRKQLAKDLGPSFTVYNRYRQNETVYKMMRTEKVAIFIILGFIVLVISCNILGSLSMLILEKKDDVEILETMGASPTLIRWIFLLEGWLISILGLLTGLILGLVICLLQIKLGLIPMPGNFIVKYYPVVIQGLDLVIVAVTVLGLGFLAAYAPVRSVFNKAISAA